MILKVLHIDSNPAEHLVTDLALRSIPCDVMSARHASDGLRCAVDFDPHLILLDMDVPGGEDGQACLQLRSNGYKGRILLVASFFDVNVAYALDQYQADGFISKPISRGALLEQIQSLGFIMPTTLPV
jgi:CheY-like chemotaxis protein